MPGNQRRDLALAASGGLVERHYQKVYIAIASRNWLNLVFTLQLQMCMLCII